MKKLTFLLVSTSLLAACNNSTKEAQDQTVQTEEEVSSPVSDTDQTSTFELERIPMTTADLGDFPFFTLPKGIRETNKPLVSDFDVCFFPVDGKMTAFEGKLYKSFISAERGETFSQHYFEKSMADYLQSVGAVKVFDGEITKEEYERYQSSDPHKGGEGDMGYWNKNMKFWVIRSAEKGNIYVQYTSDNASASLNIVQEEAFVQTITKVTSEDITKDLLEKGKSILYINFDTDKSLLTADGLDVVQQISKALKNESTWKISIEGHTDNAGSAAHNKKLSEQRAQTVRQALTENGIDPSRLTAVGYGAEKPLFENNSEDHKSKNRRVELIKIN